MRSEAHLTCGVDFWRALRVWCIDMISWPHSASENAQKSTTCSAMQHYQSCVGIKSLHVMHVTWVSFA